MLEKITEKYIEECFPDASNYEREKIREDWRRKEQISSGIVRDFESRIGDVRDKKILDIGFGNGVTLTEFATHGALMSGLEVNKTLYGIAQEITSNKSVEVDLKLYNGNQFPFVDQQFDHIYSVSVLEHVSNPVDVIREACRVLKPGGRFYLAFPNRLYPKETHTGIWFLSYLPRLVADRLLRLFGRKSIQEWNLHFLSYWWLCRLLKKHRIPFVVVDESTRGGGLKKQIKRILWKFGIHHSAILPHVMIILEKDAET